MKHLFVTYEIAKLLKQEGFNENCFSSMQNENNPNKIKEQEFCFCPSQVNFNRNDYTLIPLYQQVIDFLMKDYKLLLVPIPVMLKISSAKTRLIHGDLFRFDICSLNDENFKPIYTTKKDLPYYKALDEAIKKSLELI